MTTHEEAETPEAQLNAAQVLAAGEDLLAAFGVHDLDPLGQPEAYAQTLQELSPRHKGDRTLVRFELEEDETRWPEEIIATTNSLAKRFGMLKHETPLEGQFNLIVAMGAARRALYESYGICSRSAGRRKCDR